ncbi:Aste57867_24547 [Aphanomyces stellatus]|uniref:Aste57867_24547 protein n=1 Tax=Aphanomyces stellatus TaxID=120398 RepID=A0A485LRS5_9STRA|nr:hypothetical protein As57867_024470 [Aphanomyces stellatus]VFU01186.1 Aste57867_24547 [Aphanomyces stellatus]
MAAEKQRIHKSVEEKMKIVAFVESGMSHQATAKEFGISRTAVTKMVKEKALIAAKLEQPDLKRKRRAASPPSEASSPTHAGDKVPRRDVKNLIDAVKVLTDADAPQTSREEQQPIPAHRRPRVLLAASGSVATVKIPELAMKLAEVADVQVVLTKAASFFMEKASTYNASAFAAFQALAIPIHHDDNEWSEWNAMGDAVLHIHLREWADVLCIAPLSANTMAKIAHGLCDNLLTCVVRAWSSNKPLLVAPAMNTQMYLHPATGKQLGMLREYGYTIIPPVCKTLACGEVGNGALAAVDTIAQAVLHAATTTAPSSLDLVL